MACLPLRNPQRKRCPVILLVVADSEDLAKWCRRPCPIGHPGFELHPVVVSLPELAGWDLGDPEKHPALSVLIGLSHAPTATSAEPLFAAVKGCAMLPEQLAQAAFDLLLTRANERALKSLEAMMQQHEYQSEFARKYLSMGREEGREEGRQEAKTEALLLILASRGIRLPAAQQERVAACRNAALLDSWVRKALSASSAEDVFGSTEP